MAKKASKAERKRQNAAGAPRPAAPEPPSKPAQEIPQKPPEAPQKPRVSPKSRQRPSGSFYSRWSAWAAGPWPYVLLGVLMTCLLLLQTGGSDREIGFGMAIIFIAATVGFRSVRRLRDRLSIPVLAVFAYLALNAAASLYSKFGNTAPHEFGKILAAFGCYGIILFRAKREDGKRLAAMTASVLAVIAFFSIDASSLGALSTPLVSLLEKLGCDFTDLFIGYETGVRVTGLFGNANILAGMLGLGVFLSLYLVQDTHSRWGRLGACLVLGVNTLCFLLNFSMGAIAMFMVAVVIYLLAARKGNRISLFLLMVETAVAALITAFLALRGLGASGAAGVLPPCAAILCGLILWAFRRYLGEKLTDVLNRHAKVTAAVVCILVLIIVGYVVLGFQLTGSYTLSGGETLRRSVYPSAGSYTVSGTWSGDVSVRVESQNSADTMMHTSTILYSGPLNDAAFTVPEDSKVVYLNFTSPGGAELENVSLSDGTAVKLGYKLFPGFVANRIQGLFANQNAIQRLVFFQDGMRMYAKSPIIGNGLGSVGGMVHSVQDFYYVSRFVHNHYIQIMVEMGIPGILVFLFMLGSAAVTLWKRRREGESGLLHPALCACLTMLAGHAVVEAVWSISAYQVIALAVLAMIAVCYGRPIAKLAIAGAEWVAALALWIFIAVFAWLLWGNISAERQFNAVMAGSAPLTADTMPELAGRDHYNWAQYKLDLAVNAANAEVERYQSLAVTYAQELRGLKQYSVNRSLEEYHYLPRGEYAEMFEASREGIVQLAADAKTWQDEFTLYERWYGVYLTTDGADPQWYAEQCLATYAQLVEFNQGRMEQITLSEQNNAFISEMQKLQDNSHADSASSP